MRIKIKSNDIAIMANRIDRMHKSDLPIAVRSTLNNMAFRMQKTEIAKSAERTFDYKRTNVVRNLSYATKATGFDIKRMRSISGIRELPNRQRVARGLAAQEVGGRIEGKSTPKLGARGGSPSNKVRRANKLSSNNTINARNKRRNKYIATAVMAKQTGSFLIIATRSGSAVARVSRITRKKNGAINIRLRWMYQLHDDNKEIKRSNTKKFMKKAYLVTMTGFNAEFHKQAHRRLSK